MQRTKYFNQTRPTDTQLNWTESSRVNAIRQRFRSGSQMGISWGFRVTVNTSDNTKIDISRGEGYTGGVYTVDEFEGLGSGERISTYTDSPSGPQDLGPAATGQALADYTNGVRNYISLVFSESESTALAERTYPFTAHNTIVTEEFTVSALSATDWTALSETERNNRVLVAIVTANGPGVALTSSSIDQFVQPKTHPSVSTPSTIIGVTPIGVAETTPLGNGAIRWAPSSNELFWTAPGDSEGTGVTVTDSGQYVLYSDDTDYSLIVAVVYANLTTVAATSEVVQVTSLYGRAIPMFSGVDQAHRDMLGTGNASTTNPHGLTLNDISGGGFDHADLFHENAISKDADPTQLLPQVDGVNDRIQVTNLGGYNNSYLVDGRIYDTLTGVTAGNYGYITFDTTPQPAAGDYLIYVDSAGALQKVLIGGYVAGSVPENPFWTANIQILDIYNTTAGTGTLNWDTADSSLTWTAPGDAVGPKVYLQTGTSTGIFKVYSDNDDWILLEISAGGLGATNSSNITITKDETDYADESMLKICIVNWTGGGAGSEQLTDLRDIRSYVTADNREEVQEEHDSEGRHTKILQQQFRVNAGTDSFAIYGAASDVGVYGRADSETGVYGWASETGVKGSASDSIAVHASAPNSALIASAGVDYAIIGQARSYGVVGSATQRYGVLGVADVAIGAYVVAPDTALVVSADDLAITATVANDNAIIAIADNSAIYAAASDDIALNAVAANNYAIKATALADVAITATADNDAIKVTAGGNKAISASVAGNTCAILQANADTGVYAIADGQHAVYATASSSGVAVVVDVATGVYADGGAREGVHGWADTTGVYGGALNTGIMGEANVNYGVYGTASSIAIYGKATDNGVYGAASDENGIGVYGRALDDISGTGVAGRAGSGAGGAGAIGVYGEAGANAVGVYGIAGDTGVYGEVTGAGGFGGRFVNNGGAFAIECSGLIHYSGVATIGTAGKAGQDELVPIWVDASLRYIRLWA